MLRILTFILRTFLIAAAIVRVISAQTTADETLPVNKSQLSAISLPAGGRSMMKAYRPSCAVS